MVTRDNDGPGLSGETGLLLLAGVLLVGLLSMLLYLSTQGVFGQTQEPEADRAPEPAAISASPTLIPSPLPTAAPAVASAIEPAATPTPATPTATPIPLSEDLESYVAGLPGTYGVAIRELESGETVLIDADRVFPSASLYKVLVMYRAYQMFQRGDLAPESSITIQAGDLAESAAGDGLSVGDKLAASEAVEWMITFSSNPASYALARSVGGWNQVTTAASELGMERTTYDGDGFVTTPADMLRFFELLGTRSLVSPEASDEMTAVLLRQEINDRIPARLPEGTRVAHKTGELPEVRNDAGIVFAGEGRFAIAILSEGIDPEKAAEAHATIARKAFDRFRD